MIGELLARGKYCSSALDGLTLRANGVKSILLLFSLTLLTIEVRTDLELDKKDEKLGENDEKGFEPDYPVADAARIGILEEVHGYPIYDVDGVVGASASRIDLAHSYPINLAAINTEDVVVNFFPRLIVEVRRRVNAVLINDDQVARCLKALEKVQTTDDEMWSLVINALSDRVARTVYSFVIDNLSHLLGTLKFDKVTKLLSQTAFRTSMPILFEALKREGKGFAVISCDIDYFKAINDDPDLGHDCGDKVLGKIGHILSTKVKRGVDIVARNGGEEFTLVLIGASFEEAIRRAEEIRSLVEETIVEFKGRKFRCTMSFGVTVFDSKIDENFDDVVGRSYRAFHMGKEYGRNITVSVKGGQKDDEFAVEAKAPSERPRGVLWSDAEADEEVLDLMLELTDSDGLPS